MSMTEINLYACPFCGGEASFEHLDDGSWSVGCSDAAGTCFGFQSLVTFSRKCEAATAWNTRPQCGAPNYRMQLRTAADQERG